MQDLSQPRIIKSGPKKVGRPFGSVPPNKLPSQLPHLAGKQFGRLIVVSGEVVRKRERGRAYLRVECSTCKQRSLKEYGSLVTQRTAGCRSCGSPRQVPKWLYQRAQSAQARCTNPKDRRYAGTGSRGIEFRFSSPMAMALWVQENLGLHRDLQLDRIDNDGHYAPGNLRYSRKRPLSPKIHSFRQNHPDIKYSDASLSRMFSLGMTDNQIIDRFHRSSLKPKGVYGTFLTPDPFIVSLLKDS